MRVTFYLSILIGAIALGEAAHSQNYGYTTGGDPLCSTSYDPNVSNVNGWGWQDTTGNGQANSCRIQHQYGYENSQYSHPYCSEGYTPTSQQQVSGWGWEDTDLDGSANSCVLSHEYGYTSAGTPYCSPTYSGPNTGGYGWEDTNNDGDANSCFIQTAPTHQYGLNQYGEPYCSPGYDGPNTNGYGWEDTDSFDGPNSCVIQNPEHQWGVHESGTPYCSPNYSGSNTNGYGWEDTDNYDGPNSCLIQTASIAPPFSSCINLGNDFEVPVGETWRIQTSTSDIDAIYNAGFDAIRIPVKWSDRASASSPYSINSAFFTELDAIVDHAMSKSDFKVILDVHHYDDLMADPNGQEQRFKKIWEQIADHYQNYSDELIFEVINEPFIDYSNAANNRMDIARINRLNEEILDIIRVDNPNRWVIVGGGNWGVLDSNGQGLVSSDPPDDPKVMVTFHYYLPFNFTHQGAAWANCRDSNGNPTACTSPVYWGTSADYTKLNADLDLAENFRDSVNQPLLIGEFGVYGPTSGGGALLSERAEWAQALRENAEERDMAWCHWDFQAGFPVWDSSSDAWISDMLDALQD